MLSGHLFPNNRQLLLAMSRSTMDRVLKPTRQAARPPMLSGLDDKARHTAETVHPHPHSGGMERCPARFP